MTWGATSSVYVCSKGVLSTDPQRAAALLSSAGWGRMPCITLHLYYLCDTLFAFQLKISFVLRWRIKVIRFTWLQFAKFPVDAPRDQSTHWECLHLGKEGILFFFFLILKLYFWLYLEVHGKQNKSTERVEPLRVSRKGCSRSALVTAGTEEYECWRFYNECLRCSRKFYLFLK